MSFPVQPTEPATRAGATEPTPPGRAGRHAAGVEALGAAVPESIATLRAAVRCTAALARYDEAFERSPCAPAAVGAFELLEVAGLLALEGTPVDTAQLLLANEAQREPAATRLLQGRARGRAALTDADGQVGRHVSRAWLDACAAHENAGRRGVRTRGVGQRERALLPDGARLPRGQVRLESGIDALLTLCERGARDADPAVLVATVHRRWLALRPYSVGNERLGRLLDEALLRNELLLRTAPLLCSRWLAARADRYRGRLLAGASGPGEEANWVRWWLETLADATNAALACLVGWEALLARADTSVATRQAQPGRAALTVTLRPIFSLQQVVDAGPLSHARCVRWLDQACADGEMRAVDGSRERRFTRPDLLSLLLETSG